MKVVVPKKIELA